MRLPPPLHSWEVAPSEAVALQRELAGRVDLSWDDRPVERVAGVDVSFDRFAPNLYAAAVVLSFPRLEVLEKVALKVPVSFPYVPGLLSFREVPPVLACFERLDLRPDLVVCDGQGTAHPRRFGLACHLGLWLDMPTIGCAKSRLVGSHREPGHRRGCSTRLIHPDGDVIGRCLRTRDGVRPVYCSPGHLIDLETATRCLLRLTRGYRLPETTRQAHRLANRRRREDGIA